MKIALDKVINKLLILKDMLERQNLYESLYLWDFLKTSFPEKKFTKEYDHELIARHLDSLEKGRNENIDSYVLTEAVIRGYNFLYDTLRTTKVMK